MSVFPFDNLLKESQTRFCQHQFDVRSTPRTDNDVLLSVFLAGSSVNIEFIIIIGVSVITPAPATPRHILSVEAEPSPFVYAMLCFTIHGFSYGLRVFNSTRFFLLT